MTDVEKIEIWNNQEKHINRFIEWKGLLVGAKDKPRHATSIRWRADKDDR